MKLTSVNEFLERKFRSKLVRLAAALLFLLNQLLYLGVALVAPATAINAGEKFHFGVEP